MGTKTWAIRKALKTQKKRSHQGAVDICPSFLGDTCLSLLTRACCVPGEPLQGWKQGVPTTQVPPEPSGNAPSPGPPSPPLHCLGFVTELLFAMETPESCLVLPWVWPSSFPPPSGPVFFLSEGRSQPDTFLP